MVDKKIELIFMEKIENSAGEDLETKNPVLAEQKHGTAKPAKEETTNNPKIEQAKTHAKDLDNTKKESKNIPITAKKETHKGSLSTASSGEAAPKPFFVKKKSQFSDYKLFNRWSFADVIISDPSMVRYVNLDPIIIPHSFGRKTRGRFEKANVNIVERLVNKLMRSGQGKRKLSGKFIRGRGSCGKKMEAIDIVENAFDLIEKQTKQNPIQVYVRAVENSAPREDVTRVKKGGVAYTLAVDVSPLKRLDEAIKNIALGGFGGSFNKKISASAALADEIIAASNNEIKSSSIKRKDEVERIAKASR